MMEETAEAAWGMADTDDGDNDHRKRKASHLYNVPKNFRIRRYAGIVSFLLLWLASVSSIDGDNDNGHLADYDYAAKF